MVTVEVHKDHKTGKFMYNIHPSTIYTIANGKICMDTGLRDFSDPQIVEIGLTDWAVFHINPLLRLRKYTDIINCYHVSWKFILPDDPPTTFEEQCEIVTKVSDAIREITKYATKVDFSIYRGIHSWPSLKLVQFSKGDEGFQYHNTVILEG